METIKPQWLLIARANLPASPELAFSLAARLFWASRKTNRLIQPCWIQGGSYTHIFAINIPLHDGRRAGKCLEKSKRTGPLAFKASKSLRDSTLFRSGSQHAFYLQKIFKTKQEGNSLEKAWPPDRLHRQRDKVIERWSDSYQHTSPESQRRSTYNFLLLSLKNYL